MKIFKYTSIVILTIIAIGIFTNPGLERHQSTVRKELIYLTKNKFNDSLSKNNIINTRIDSLVQVDNYFVFSKTKLIVDDKLKEIGIGCLGKVWMNEKFESVGEKLISRLINTPIYFSAAEISLDESIDSTVAIGTQVWMKKNFDGILYNNGDTIPQVKDASEWVNLKTGAWCYLGNDSSNLKLKGRLYNWYALNDSRGIAPEGFKVPEKEDWEILARYLGEHNLKTSHLETRNKFQKVLNTISDKFSLNGFENTVGYKLKKPIGWSNKGNGSNESGFGAVPAGERYEKGLFTRGDSHWWCRKKLPSGKTSIFFVGYDNRRIFTTDLEKFYGFSIRFIKK
jgi:uncharacterized protein (TIGR02145 family)